MPSVWTDFAIETNQQQWKAGRMPLWQEQWSKSRQRPKFGVKQTLIKIDLSACRSRFIRKLLYLLAQKMHHIVLNVRRRGQKGDLSYFRYRMKDPTLKINWKSAWGYRKITQYFDIIDHYKVRLFWKMSLTNAAPKFEINTTRLGSFFLPRCLGLQGPIPWTRLAYYYLLHWKGWFTLETIKLTYI